MQVQTAPVSSLRLRMRSTISHVVVKENSTHTRLQRMIQSHLDHIASIKNDRFGDPVSDKEWIKAVRKDLAELRRELKKVG